MALQSLEFFSDERWCDGEGWWCIIEWHGFKFIWVAWSGVALQVRAGYIPELKTADGIFERILQGFLMKDFNTMHLTNLVVPH